jgi:hypothetical protein
MKPRLQTLSHDGKTYRLGQTATAKNFLYTGQIKALYAQTVAQPARVWICRDGDQYGRIVKIDLVEIVG